MHTGIWVSTIQSDGRWADKVGLRTKFFDLPWEAPYGPQHYVPRRPPHVRQAIQKGGSGEPLQRGELPEASAVYDASRFAKSKVLFSAGGFMAAKGKLAEILLEADFGPGGGLIPYTIYEADETTPLPGPFYLLNFGAHEPCFRPDESQRVYAASPTAPYERNVWSASGLQDGDVAVSSRALSGSDIWIERALSGAIFMSDRLAAKLLKAKLGLNFRLTRCRVVDEGDEPQP